MSVESTRARIAAAVEHVRARKGNIEQTARQFGMTTDVLKRSCKAAGVSDFRVGAAITATHGPLAAPAVSPLGFPRVQRGKLWT